MWLDMNNPKHLREFLNNLGAKKKASRIKKKKLIKKNLKLLVEYPKTCFRDACDYSICKHKDLFAKAPGSRHFIDFLYRKNFECIGSGAYSQVYAKKNSDRVLKVTLTQDNWIDYIHWSSQEGYSGTLAPRVYSYKKYSEYSVAVVERMDKTLSKLSEKDDLKILSDLLYHSGRGNEMAQLLMDEIVPGFSSFLKELRKRFKGQRLDLHSGNIMVRKDGSLAVTDPVCDTAGPTIESIRLRAKDFTSLASALRRFNCKLFLTLKLTD